MSHDTNYNPSYSYAFATKTHQEWQNNINRWRFYNNSFTGGDQYAKGEYLTHYIYEDNGTYKQRIASTPLDNHCKNVIEIFSSMLFSTPPRRDLSGLENDPTLDYFLEDCDMDGRSMDQFMRDVHQQAAIYGHVVCVVDRPDVPLDTKQKEIEAGVRPYLNLYNAENVVDWKWERSPNGKYELSMLKILEYADRDQITYRYYYKDRTDIVTTSSTTHKTEVTQSYANPLGYIPAVWIYNQRSAVRGIGISDLSDIADLQRAIYDHTAELDSTLKLSNNPSICATGDVDLNAGPGAVITMPAGMDPALKPYIIQPGSQGIQSILDSIQQKVDAIDRMAHLGGVRTTATKSASGISLLVERQLLNARLQSKGHQLELAEEQIWNIWSDWQNVEWTGYVQYPSGFNMRDVHAELQNLKLARDIGVANERANREIDNRVIELVITDQETQDYVLQNDPDGPEQGQMGKAEGEHPTLTAETWRAHVQEMISQGYTLAEIETLHPELTQLMLAEQTQA